MLGIAGKCHQRLSGRFQDGVVAFSWKGSHDASSSFGHGEAQEEVGTWQQFSKLLFKPAFAFVGLTGRTMPVATRARHTMGLAALLAGVNDDTEVVGSTIFDRPHGFELIGRHVRAELLPIRLAIELKDFSHGVHDGRMRYELTHQPLNLTDGRFFAVRRHVQVHGGRLQRSMSQVFLDESQVDTGLE